MRKNRILLYLIMVLQGMVFYSSIATLYRQVHGVTIFHITLIETIYFVLVFFLEVPWGYVADRIGYKKTLIICNVLFVISKVIFWKANTFALFLIERLLLAVIFAGLSGVDTSFLFFNSPEPIRQKTFSIYQGMTMAGMLLSSLSYSLFFQNDFSLAAFATLLVYVVAAILTFFLSETKPEHSEITLSIKNIVKELVAEFVRDKRFILFLIAAALLAEVNQVITVFVNQLQYIASAIEVQKFGFLHALLTTASLASFCSALVAKKLGKKAFSFIMFLCATISCLCAGIWQIAWISVLSMIVLRISASLFAPFSLLEQNRHIISKNHATILSSYSMLMNTVSLIPNLAIGKLGELNVRYALFFGAGVCIVGMVCIMIYQKTHVS